VGGYPARLGGPYILHEKPHIWAQPDYASTKISLHSGMGPYMGGMWNIRDDNWDDDHGQAKSLGCNRRTQAWVTPTWQKASLRV
jgi:hypothetical protein